MANGKRTIVKAAMAMNTEGGVSGQDGVGGDGGNGTEGGMRSQDGES
jgi:hypothetical protein